MMCAETSRGNGLEQHHSVQWRSWLSGGQLH